MRLNILFICLLFLSNGCASESTPKKELPKHNFQQRYEGLIGSHRILMNFIVENDAISGRYFYDSTGGELRFNGKFVNADSVFFEEKEKKVGGRVTGTFEGKMSDDQRQITGKWYNKQKELELNLSYSDLDYDSRLNEIEASKTSVINLLKFQGKTSLSPILNYKAFFPVDYSKSAKSLEKVIIIISIGDKNIKELNDKIDNAMNSIESIADNLALDKRAKILYELLKKIDTKEIFSESDGSNARLNTYLVCSGVGKDWRDNNTMRSYFKVYDNKTYPASKLNYQEMNYLKISSIYA